MPAVQIDGHSLTLDQLEAVARHNQQAALAPGAVPAIQASRDMVARIVESGQPAYGINTGFGALSDRAIPADQTRQLQSNLLHSHATGTGELLEEDIVRAVMLLRANSLSLGYSGVRQDVIETLLALLNMGFHPLIPSQGSLGASGDLAPLAHMSLALIGSGEVHHNGRRVPARDALRATDISPLELEPKEALALINGTPVLAGLAALALVDAERLLATATSVAALSMAGLNARREPFDDNIHRVRPHPGQMKIAGQIRDLLSGTGSGTPESKRIQDPYSIRCVPQVYGAVVDALRPLRDVLQIEVNAATDNPLIFPEDGAVISGGNFHGHPLALQVELAKIAVASLGTIVERRVAVLVDGEDYGLPAFLVKEPGVNSGYMLAHYLTAGLVAENRVLSHPSSVDSIPTSANVEDYNSMGTTAARHFRQIVGHVETIVAVEALCAAQACDLSGRIPDGPLGELHARIRGQVPTLERDDRQISEEIDLMRDVVHSGDLIADPLKGGLSQ